VPAAEAQKFGLPTDKPLYVVIWTTTPWTIPANLAIAAPPRGRIRPSPTLGAERIIVASALLGSVASAAKLEPQPAVVMTLPGPRWRSCRPRHPFIDRASPVVLADYVTTDSGTGAVHTAPGHGAEDYQTGLKYGLRSTARSATTANTSTTASVPADLVGLTTLETVEDLAAKKPSPANLGVLKKLADAGALLAKAKYRTATRIAGAPRPRSSSAPWTSGSCRSTRPATARSPSSEITKIARRRAGSPRGARPASAAPSNRAPTGASAASAPGACPSSPSTARTSSLPRRRRRPRRGRQDRHQGQQFLV
jgi:hypothetical protein